MPLASIESPMPSHSSIDLSISTPSDGFVRICYNKLDPSGGETSAELGYLISAAAPLSTISFQKRKKATQDKLQWWTSVEDITSTSLKSIRKMFSKDICLVNELEDNDSNLSQLAEALKVGTFEENRQNIKTIMSMVGELRENGNIDERRTAENAAMAFFKRHTEKAKSDDIKTPSDDSCRKAATYYFCELFWHNYNDFDRLEANAIEDVDTRMNMLKQISKIPYKTS